MSIHLFNNDRLRSFFFLTSFVCVLTSTHGATTITSYSFTGGSSAADTTAANITASAFAVPSSGNVGISSTSDTAFIQATSTPSSLGNPLTTEPYFQFTVEVASGFQLSLTSLIFDHMASSNASSFDSNISTFINDFSFGDALDTSSGSSVASNSNAHLVNDNFTITLSGGSFDDLTGTQTVRFYVFDDSTSTGDYVRIDNIVLSGTLSPIPELKAFGLLTGVSGLFCVLMLRRRRG